ncbi:hypothetical protein [Oceanobacillus halotolerans]|uniref:hypothetical protein n=1 Tax=Oceanobacillus halotolerans TaxID=2663380 RepID=UPI0013DD5DB3|nr:hypothetical protein [Oceanobacillus halotolerans]
MQGLLEAIFSNFFIIIVIIAGLLGFLRDNAAKGNKKQEQRPRQQRPSPTRQPRPSRTPSGPTQAKKVDSSPVDSSRQIQSTSIEQQREDQMKRLADQIQTEGKQDLDEKVQNEAIQDIMQTNEDKRQKQQLTEEQFQLKQQIKHNLTKKGLVNGIVMAEVLGPPRSRKPYQSIIHERNK